LRTRQRKGKTWRGDNMNHPKNYGYSEGFLFALHVLSSMGL
jgi:hypothetical protein